MENIDIATEFLIELTILDLAAQDYFLSRENNRFDMIENGVQEIKSGMMDNFKYPYLGTTLLTPYKISRMRKRRNGKCFQSYQVALSDAGSAKRNLK